MSVPNRTELCFAALQRSGHHAIANWVLANSSGPNCFLNNCRPNTNPFLSCHEHESVFDGVDFKQESSGRFSPKNLLIYNYEDRQLHEIFSPGFLLSKQKSVGESERTVNVLVLRDPFNNIASKYLWAVNGKKWPPPLHWVLHELPELWKAYAREFLGMTDLVPAPKIFINYNRWATSSEYRSEIAQILELQSCDKGLSQVARWGPNTWGDSFDNLDFEGRANEMKILERWRFFENDRAYKDIFRDRELIALSEKIFGVIPGTNSLYQTRVASSSRMIDYQEEAPGVISVSLYARAECEAILQRLRQLDSWKPAQVRLAQDAVNYQVLTRPDVRSANVLDSPEAEELYRQFHARMNATVKPLIKQLWRIDLATQSGTHILRYGPADHYAPHQDTGPTFLDRYFSLVCYLNDDFVGGQTSFPPLHYSVTPKAGKAILFPSTYGHGSNPVTSGEKFVFVSWINGPVPIKWI